MTTIFGVTSGEYSDYHVEGLFDSQEKAQAYIDYENAHGYGDFGIEEWELNQHYDPIQRGLTCYRVFFVDITQGDATANPRSATDEVEVSSRNYRTHVPNYTTYVWAKNEQGALKIANERRVQFLLKLEQEQAQEDAD